MKAAPIQGRIRNLSARGPMGKVACLEAIRNAVDAIRECKRSSKSKSVTVILHRKRAKDSLEFKDPGDKPLPISDIEVVDEGIGFTDRHYDSFNELDTMMKAKLGGRGVGRLLYLIAFEEVRVESSFKKEKKWIDRKFNFGLHIPENVSRAIDRPAVKEHSRTSVRLCGLKKEHAAGLPLDLEEVADFVIGHWLNSFIEGSFPAMKICDANASRNVDVQKRFQTQHFISKESGKFTLQNEEFTVDHVRIKAGQAKRHEFVLCGQGHSVRAETLTGCLATGPLRDRVTGCEFFYQARVSSAFLDDSLDANRLRFNIDLKTPAGADLTRKLLVTETDIARAVQKQARNHLRKELRKATSRLWAKVVEYVSQRAPQYRYLLGKRQIVLDHVADGMTEVQLDAILYKLDQRFAAKLRKTGAALQKSIKSGEDYGLIKTRYERYLSDLNRRGIDQLAQYVVHRRTVLDLLETALSRKKDGSAFHESFIHGIIAPLRKTSDDLPIENFNLWIIDEKFAFHRYLASDIPLVPAVPKKSQKGARPDVILFDNASYFSGTDEPFESVVIVEFKRPFRKSFGSEDPAKQLQRYVENVIDGKAKRSNGRAIKIKDGARFYCYSICEITPALAQKLDRDNLKRTADGDGWWQFNDALRAYFEVIPFEKMLSDAKRRNHAFFNQLNLS